MIKPLIVIDLDIVTVYLWNHSAQAEEAKKFIEKIKNFKIISPYTLIELAEKWQYIELKEKIIAFYKKYTTTISAEEVKKKLEEFKIDDKELAISLIAHGIKEEDAALIVITSIMKADYLITFNRKHLRNKEHQINDVLKSFNLPQIKIRTPRELLEEVQNEK